MKPIPRLNAAVILQAIYRGRNDFRVLPISSFLIRKLIIIQPVDKIDQNRRLISDDSETVPVMSRHSDQLQFPPGGDDLIQLLCLIIIGADLQRAPHHKEMVDLPALMPMPGPELFLLRISKRTEPGSRPSGVYESFHKYTSMRHH